MKMRLSRSDFPEGFVFGAATAAYQIEGTRFGGCGPNHWDSFAATPFNVVRAEDGALACDHYHRWPADLDLVRAANMDGYRFSTSWSRVMPDGRRVNPEGLDFYDRLVDGMLERGLKPFQTLYHWDLPSALADKGGWTNRDVAAWFADFNRWFIEGNVPIYVTESGMSNADVLEDGSVSDGIREDYLFAHLAATRRAMDQGANVKGFFYWSLLDNYEWAEGYEKRFGLVHVDFTSLERTPKSSYHAFADALARND